MTREQQPFPRQPGTYVLILSLARGRAIQVGRFGSFFFPVGAYLYFGSALGPGGLAARLRRHLALVGQELPGQPKRLHWHIDYLRQEADVTAVWWACSPTNLEHDWAALAGQLPGATMPVARFGASDCHCPSHLFHYELRPDRLLFHQTLAQNLACWPPPDSQ